MMKHTPLEELYEDLGYALPSIGDMVATYQPTDAQISYSTESFAEPLPVLGVGEVVFLLEADSRRARRAAVQRN